MEDEKLILYAKLTDSKAIKEFRDTLEREGRTMQVVLTVATAEYVARSKAKHAAEAAARLAA